jgi:hypothetical protein
MTYTGIAVSCSDLLTVPTSKFVFPGDPLRRQQPRCHELNSSVVSGRVVFLTDSAHCGCQPVIGFCRRAHAAGDEMWLECRWRRSGESDRTRQLHARTGQCCVLAEACPMTADQESTMLETPGAQLSYSKAPMSMPAPLGRELPTKSMVRPLAKPG